MSSESKSRLRAAAETVLGEHDGGLQKATNITDVVGEIDWQTSPAHRRNVDAKAKRKRELMEEYVTDRHVLHLGAGGGAVGRPDDNAEWFHGWLDERAERCVGLDTDKAAVSAAQREGYDVRLGDAQDFDIDEVYGVVVAPNIIEHVGRPADLIACAREHLQPGGWLLVTTDRITIPWWALQAWRNGGQPETHPDHVCAFTRGHLQRLLRRCGMREARYQSWGFDRAGVSLPDYAWRVVERNLARVWPSLEHVQHFTVAMHDCRECPQCGCESLWPDDVGAHEWHCRTCGGGFPQGG